MQHTIVISLAMVLGLAGAANAQTAAAPAGPPAGPVDTPRASTDNHDATAAYNEKMGSNDKAKRKGSGPAVAADIKPGAALRDINGVPIGTIASVDDKQVVVDTGETKIGVPLKAFGKDDHGLLLSMTADQFKQAIAKAHAKSQAAAEAQASH